MKLTLDIKQSCPCFWLSCVRSVRTDRQGSRCLIGDRIHTVYEQTRHKNNAHVELDIPENPRTKAYYLCGEKPHDEGAHIAFVPCENQSVLIDNKWFRLTISNARQIDFAGCQTRIGGVLADQPLAFANYLSDRMSL